MSNITHPELIRAVLDGKTLQVQRADGTWQDIAPSDRAIRFVLDCADDTIRVKS